MKTRKVLSDVAAAVGILLAAVAIERLLIWIGLSYKDIMLLLAISILLGLDKIEVILRKDRKEKKDE